MFQVENTVWGMAFARNIPTEQHRSSTGEL